MFLCAYVHAHVCFPNCLQIYVCDHFGEAPWGVIFPDEGTYFILSYEIAYLIGAQVSWNLRSSLNMQKQTPGMFFNQP